MGNGKVRDLGQSEEDSLETTSKSAEGSKASTSSSTCPFSLSGHSPSSVLQGAKGEEHQHQHQHQQMKPKQSKPKLPKELQAQDQQREWVKRGSMKRALGGADNQQEQEQEPAATSTSASAPTESNRCNKCNKKLGLTGGFPCRCGGVFCAVHRYSDRHECNFDYRELGASEIRRDNPVVAPSKLKKL